MNTAVQTFVKKPTSALNSLWNRLKPTNKYRVAYSAQSGPNQKADSTSEYDSVDDGVNELRQNLDEVFQAWLSEDRTKSLVVTVQIKDKTESQGLQITLPPPATFVPLATIA